MEARVGEVSYRLKLSQEAKIHPTFYVSQLKKMIGDLSVDVYLLTQLTAEEVLISEPKVVLGFSPTSGQDEVLIKWKELPDFESS